MFKDRSTIDIVVILLTVTVGGILCLAVIGLMVMRLLHPNADVSRGAEAVGGLVQTIVGALVGFIGGRATGKWEASNGKENA